MIFYREREGQYFLFNGVWIMSIDPRSLPAWGNLDGLTEYAEVMEQNMKDIPILKGIMESKKRTFTIQGLKYVITARGQFVEV